jgi:hypothetical protein
LALAVLAAIGTPGIAADMAAPVRTIEFGGLAPRIALPVMSRAHSVVADDVNEDGKIDLIVAAAGADRVAVFLGQGGGRFAAPTYWKTGHTPKFAVTGDFNHDGHRDLVTADQDSNTISVLLGNGDGTFQPPVSYPSCNGDHEVATADFDKDGNDDVVAACHTRPFFASVFLGRGDGTLRPRLDLDAGEEPTSVAVGDFNHDGNPDLVFANRVAGTVSVLLGNGDGTFRPRVAFQTAPSPHAVRAADVNGDGILDLVTADDRSGQVSVLLGKGDGTFGPHIDLSANSLPKSIALADVNGDGHVDIIVTNTTYPTCCTLAGSTISVFLGKGDGTFESRRDYFSGGNPFSLLVRDLDGDGKPDVTTANYIDITPAQLIYLRTAGAVRLSSFQAKAAGLAIILTILVAALLVARRHRSWIAGIGAVLMSLALAAGLYYCSHLRFEGESHVSILRGR